MHTVQGVEPKQEINRAEKRYTNMDSISKLRDNKTKPMDESKSNKITVYFLSGLSYEGDKQKSAKTMQQIHKDLDDVFNDIGYFDGTFSLQLKPDSKPCQAPPRCMPYALPKQFQEEFERLQK